MTTSGQRQGFWVADCWVQPALNQLVKDGRPLSLEPKVMALLEKLAAQPGEVLSRQELENSISQGTVVGYDALSKAVNKLREALGDDKTHPQYIQTISKRGYRLIAAVRAGPPPEQSALAVEQIEQATTGDAARKVNKSRRMLTLGSVIAIALLTAVTVYWTGRETNTVTQPPRAHQQTQVPTIVILPLRNISASREDDYLADGLTSDLITDLSKLSSLSVLSTSTVLAEKNENSASRYKREFNTQYMLSGDLIKSDKNIRINIRLTDLRTETILWADRYDKKFTDLFEIQDDVKNKIVESLSLTLTKEEKRRISRRYTRNFQAYELFLRAQALLHVRTREENALAREMYLKAITLDPGFARAHAGLALTYANSYVRQWPDDVPDRLQKALDRVKKAIAIDDELPESYWVAGNVYAQLKDTDQAIAHLNKALELNPNYADAYAMLGSVYINSGRPALTLRNLEKAMRINPAGGYIYLLQVGRAHYFLGNYDLALEHLAQSHSRNPAYVVTMLYMVATYVNLQRLDDAAWMLGLARNLDPNIKLEDWINALPFTDVTFREKLYKDIASAEVHANEK